MLRITSSNGESVLRLRLEGHVTGPWVQELRRVCHDALDGRPNLEGLVLDLAEVSFIDADGIELFRELKSRQVSFSNCSLFVAQQLKGVS